MFEFLNTLLSKNPAMRDLTIVIMFAAGLFANYTTMQKVSALESSSTAYPYEVISYSLAGISESGEVVGMVNKWKGDGWGAQVAAAKVLCNSEKNKLPRLLGNQGAVDFCRVSR